MTRYLIIGSSSGGIGAAEAIRQLDRHGPLTMVSEEPFAAYSRPLIARYLAGETSLERMAYRPPRFYQDLGIRLLTGHPLAERVHEKRRLAVEVRAACGAGERRAARMCRAVRCVPRGARF